MKKLVEQIDEILEPLKSWIPTFRNERGCYSYIRDDESCLYATLECVSTESLLGISDPELKANALDFIKNCQSPDDGYFRCPSCSNKNSEETNSCPESNKDGLTFKAATTLFMAGIIPLYPLPEGQLLHGDIGNELKSIFEENNPYTAGSVVWKRAGMKALKLLSEGKDPAWDPYIRQIIDWLLEHQDPETGLWYPEGDIRNGYNGLLKMRYGTFDPCGIKIPNPTKILDSILSTQSPDGRFACGCGDWNAAGLLANLSYDIPAYRERILSAYEKLMPVMRAKQYKADGGLAWDPGEVSTLKSTFVNATGLLAIKSFILHDKKTLDMIFHSISVRHKLIGR